LVFTIDTNDGYVLLKSMKSSRIANHQLLVNTMKDTVDENTTAHTAAIEGLPSR